MPLVRYEVRCEHSLANPELYRTAGRDDSEGLLEGVAMAGLVGIVRQLGDMAEFAAEIFQDLHDDIMKIVSRGQNLKGRVARLEAELPAVEKKLLMEASQLTFAYSTRSKWHASLPMDQNLCAQGEVPRFVRNFYDDCRGPPRLFLLDKFDEAGRGACVKRYTDPTFFKITWVSSQLVKAEQLRKQRDSELQKKNNAAEECPNNDGAKIYTRERLSSALFENLEGFTGDFTPDLRSRRLDRVLEIPIEGVLTPDEPGSPEEPRSPEHRFQRQQLPEVAEGPVLAPLKINVKDIENAALGRRISRSNDADGLSCEEEDSSTDDFYVDALTTMESDVDSEPGSRTRVNAEVQSRFAMEFEHEKSLHQSVLKPLVEVNRQTSSGRSDESDPDDDGTCKVGGFKEPDNLVVDNNTVREWGDSAESLAGSPGDQPSVEDEESLSVDESIANQSITSEESDARNGHEYVAEKVHEESLLPSILSDVSPNPFPEKPPVKVNQKVDGNHHGKLTEKVPNDVPDNPLCELPEVRPQKLPDTTPYKSPNKVTKKVSKVTPKKGLGKLSLQSHGSVTLLDVRRTSSNVKENGRTSVEGRSQSPGLENQVPQTLKEDQSASANVGQPVTPRSRRRWAKDNGSQIQTSNVLGFADTERRNLSRRLDDSLDLNNLLRSRMLGGSGHFQEEIASGSQRAVIIHEGESIQAPERLGNKSTQRRSYRNGSSSSVLEYDDGWYMSSSSSSPKGPNICALSPPESPARVARGLMGSPVAYSTNPQFGRKGPEGPPIIPFLSISPTVSRSPSLNQDHSLSPHNYPSFGRALQPTPPPQLGATVPRSWSPQTTESPAHNSDQLKDVPATDPRRATDNGGLYFEKCRIQASTLPNPAPRSRTWVDRSESNVAATLRAIRQAAAVVSDQDDDTGSEC